MSKQPEALRLAAQLEACPTINYKAHAAELRRLRAALQFIADHDLRGTDLTVAGHIAHALIGKARAALKEAK